MIVDVHSFVPAMFEEGGAGYGERDRPRGSRQRPRLGAVAIAPSDSIALVRTRPESGPQFLVHGRLNRGADVVVDQFAQRDGLKLMRSDRLAGTLSHGAFLRWPPARAAGWSCTSPTGRMRHFLFPHEWGRHRSKSACHSR